jgi:class 3 adenylate cyclase
MIGRKIIYQTALIAVFGMSIHANGVAQNITPFDLKQFQDQLPTADFQYLNASISNIRKFNSTSPQSADSCYKALLNYFKDPAKHSFINTRITLEYAYQKIRLGDYLLADSLLQTSAIAAIPGDSLVVHYFIHRIKSQSHKIKGEIKASLASAILAKQKLQKAIELEKNITAKNFLSFSLVNIQSDIANLYKDTQQYEKSLQEQKKNLSTIQSWTDSYLESVEKKPNDKITYLANAYNNLALTYISTMPQPAVADTLIVYYLNQTIANSELIGNKVFLSRAYYNYATYFQKLNNLQNSISYLYKALNENELINDATGILICKIEIASHLIKLKLEKEKALTLAQEALNTLYSLPEFAQKAQVYQVYCDALIANGKTENLIQYFDTVYQLSQAELKNAFDKEITEMQTKYETVEKENEIIKQQGVIEKKQSQMKLLFVGIGAAILFLLLILRSYLLKRKANIIIQKEKDRSDALLLNILPAQTAAELKQNGYTAAKQFQDCTILFTDFKDFTKVAELLSPEKLVSEIDFCFKAFDDIISKYKIEKIKTIGDAYMCVAGIPEPSSSHVSDMVMAAIEIRNFMDQLYLERVRQNQNCFKIRIGIHTGPLVAGVVGNKKFAYDVWGDAVNIAARMEASGETGKINISGATQHLLSKHFVATYRGKIAAKNKGEIDMYFVEFAQSAQPTTAQVIPFTHLNSSTAS